MPQAIPFVVKVVGVIKAILAYKVIGVTIATIAKVAIAVGSYAYSRSQAKRAQRAMASMDNSRGLSIREPAASRRILYGQMRMGGTMVFADTSGTNNEFLHQVIAHCDGPNEEIGTVYLNDETVPLDGSGNATGKYAGYFTVKKHLGATTQTVDTDLQTAVGSGTWSNNHRLRGICYSYPRLKHNPDLFPSGLPNYSSILKGRNDIYDPRDASTGYSTNPALCLRHYLLLPKADGGLGASASEIDEDAVIAAANICDEDVDLNPSGTEKRYTINGVVDTANEPGATIDAMCSSMAGICPYIGGKFKMKAGAHTSSVFSFTEDDITGKVSFQTRDSMRDAFNGVKGTYVTSDNDYQVSDFPPVVNATYTTEDGGARIWKDIALGFTTSPATAQRIAKIELERSRQDIVVTIETKLGAINAHAGDIVDLTLARYGWTNKLFEVTNSQFIVSDSGDGPTLGLRWTLRETAAAVWDWNSGEETVVDLAPNTDLPDLFTVATLSGLTLSQAGFLQTDGTWQPQVAVKWTQATDTYVLNGGIVDLEYKAMASVTWLVRDGAIRGDATDALIGSGITAGSGINVRARFENVRFVRGAYSSTSTITPSSDTTTPNAPTSIAGSNSAADMARVAPFYAGAGGAKYFAGLLKWTLSTSKNVAYQEVQKDVGGTLYTVPSGQTEFPYSGNMINAPAGELWRVRAVSFFGTASSWGTASSNSVTSNYGTLDMAEQAKSAVNITGGASIMGGFEANQTTAVDVRGVNFRVYSGGTQNARIDYTTGEFYIQGTRILTTQQATPTTLGDVISAGQAHGLWA
jgi:hypothetical protein